MMKLYFSPGACSLSPHIVLRETGLPFELERVDFKTGKTASGAEFKSINPKGYVPALELDDKQVLTEGPAIVQYLADRAPATGLAPSPGSFERVRLQEWLTFIGTELHKSFSPLFRPGQEEAKAAARGRIEQWFGWLEPQLGARPYLMGDRLSVADIYLWVVSGWSAYVEMPLDAFPNLVAWRKRIAERPAVQAALKAEGLGG
jgi:glutathione S-transferase